MLLYSARRGAASGVDGGTAKNASNFASSRGSLVEGPAGTRYMIGSLNNLLIWPQIAIGYEVAPNLRLGASFIWGVATMDLETYAIGANTSQTLQPNSADGKKYLQEDPATDVKARIKARDYFVPGFVASALYSVNPQIDVAAWYHWSDAIKARGEAELDAFSTDNKLNPATGVKTKTPDGKTTLEAPQPMEARIGVRFHQPREGVERTNRIDPLHDDVFDIELDGECSHDSQFDAIRVGFEGSPVVNTPGDPSGGTWDQRGLACAVERAPQVEGQLRRAPRWRLQRAARSPRRPRGWLVPVELDRSGATSIPTSSPRSGSASPPALRCG